MGTVASPTPTLGWEGAEGLVPGDEGAVVDEALCQEDARLLVAFQGGPVVVPTDASVIAQVAGGALEGQPVTLEHDLAQGWDEVVRVQLQGPFCGRRHGGGEHQAQGGTGQPGQGQAPSDGSSP